MNKTADNKSFTTEEIIIKNIILAKEYDVAYNYVQILKEQLRRDTKKELLDEIEKTKWINEMTETYSYEWKIFRAKTLGENVK